MEDIETFASRNAVSAGKQAGGAIVVNGNHIADTVQCAHCGQHFIYVKGSGVLRGYCTLCNKVTCGAKSCNYCIPFEMNLLYDELGYDLTQRLAAEEKRRSKIILL